MKRKEKDFDEAWIEEVATEVQLEKRDLKTVLREKLKLIKPNQNLGGQHRDETELMSDEVHQPLAVHIRKLRDTTSYFKIGSKPSRDSLYER